MKILLTGVTGQAGGALQKTLAPLGEVVAPLRGALDLADPQSIITVVRQARPHLVVNAAAYTAVDDAESNRDRCQAINTLAPCILAEEAKKVGAALIHYSTDYVFDGSATKPYSETDETKPLSIYGATKLAGESLLMAAAGPHLIFRTSGLYAPGGNNFPHTMLRLAAERPELKVVDDQFIGPTSAVALAEATASIVGRFVTENGFDAESFAQYSGIYNMICPGETTWYGFATQIISAAKARGVTGLDAQLIPITTADYPTAATRPAWSILCPDKLFTTFEQTLPSGKYDLLRFISTIYPDNL